MIIRRVAILGTLVAVAVVVAAPALADDLSDYLEEADQATYSGRRLIGTTWDGMERMGIMDIEHRGGLTMLSSGRSYVMVGDGKVHAIGSPEEALAYELASSADVGHRYEVAMAENASHLGRATQVMEIVEDGMLRMRMVVDIVTDAPLETQVFDGEGNLFRYSTMVEFSPSAPGMEDYEDEGEYEVMVPLDEARVPEQPGRYLLVDVYGGPADGQQAFYTDGLFTFSLFAIKGRSDIDDIATDGNAWTLDGFDYVRMVTPAEVWVLWNASGSTYALVGDLPPDHLEEVLTDLPRPGRRNWFGRMWDKLFG
jgi:hypothetical protein